ncbi:DUF1653 domain-containing protein [Lachnospiraceae bacterium OttesenSCG-928-D06]|nr:DUF1653 domain-containing protein [Lachnospiraceae bacterium OttesenSCG-928-D06]
MQNNPKPFEIYKHFKGRLYQIITIAEHTENRESLVIYQALYGNYKTYARPLSMFTSKVDKEKYKDASQEYRFELQTENSLEDITKEEEEFDLASDLDPAVYEFLEARTYEERLNILAGVRHRITDDMINTIAVACDIEVLDGDVEERYEQLKNCLLTLEKYEGTRLR